MIDLLSSVADKSVSILSLPSFVKDYVLVLFYGIFVAVVFGLYSYIAIYLERKIVARSQSRYGPTYVGPRGILVNVADLIKLISKDDTMPDGADAIPFKWSPVFAAMIPFLVLMLMPLGKQLYAVDQTFSLILPIAFLSLIPVLILLIGWSSNSKYPYIGALRSAALSIAYEIPLVLSVAGLVILTGSLNIVDIAKVQQNGTWLVFLQPLGFVIFMVAVIATAERIPFDMPFAESELVAGWKTEYSGVRYALTLLLEYGIMLITSLVAVFLFFGGWSGPTSLPGIPFTIPSEFWLFLKVSIFIFFYIWMRATFPRLRVDQLLNMCWKWLVPLAVLNIGIAIAEKALLWL